MTRPPSWSYHYCFYGFFKIWNSLLHVFVSSFQGLKKLYAFKNAHPEADIQPFLVKASSVFQDYIKRGLQDLEAQNNQNANRQLHSNTFNCTFSSFIKYRLLRLLLFYNLSQYMKF